MSYYNRRLKINQYNKEKERIIYEIRKTRERMFKTGPTSADYMFNEIYLELLQEELCKLSRPRGEK